MHLNPTKFLCLSFIIILNNFILHEKIVQADSRDSFNFENLISKFAKLSHLSKSITFATEEDRVFLNQFQELLGKYNYHLLENLLSENVTDKCSRDFKYIFESLPFGGWSIKMLDSFGKPESGILKGNIRWLGEYDECLQIYAPPKKSEGVGGFHGKYCTLKTTLKMKNNDLTLSMAVCLPDTCSSSEIIPDVISYLNLTGIPPNITDKISSVLNNTTLTCQQSPEGLSTGAIFVIFLISIFILLAVIGSSITLYERLIEANSKSDASFGTNFAENPSNADDTECLSCQSTNSIINKGDNPPSLPAWLERSKGFFTCFCLITNGERIFNTDSAEGQLPCLHGIRFLSMSWVILCHAYAIIFSALRNPLDAGDFIDHWTFEIILNGFYSVDSFFLLSAFLVAYLFFKQCEKTNGKIPWLYFYIHRYIRLTPVYIIIVAFYTTLNKHLGSGPVWPDASAGTDPNCDASWWRNLLYITNFQPDIQKCMAWTWYLANDMQFYIISPLFLVTLWRWPKIGYSVMASFLCATYVTSFVITYQYNLMTGLGNIASKFSDMNQLFLDWRDYFNKFYIKPYTRLDPYLIGIALAYFLFRRKQIKAGKLSKVTLSIGWIIASGLTFTSMFGIYHQDPSTVASSFYNALNRSGFACGLAWVIFVCINDQGGVVNNILSCKLLIPLSRLTFCAYLLHPIIELVYFSSVRRLIEFSQITLVLYYLGFLILSYAAALVASLLFESPVIRLEKLIRNKFST